MAQQTTSGPQQQVGMPAVDLRQMIGSLVAGEGLRTLNDLQVAQRGAGANMSVDVSAGGCVVADDHGTGGGFYAFTQATTVNVAITAANPSNPRVDRVVVQVEDAYQGDVTNSLGIVVVAGTPTGGATLSNLNGAAAVPGSALLLANVLVPAGATSVTTGNIGNVSAVLTAVGGGAPAGAILEWGGTTAPAGYLLCDGSAVSRTTFAALFAAISTTYGAGDGSTTFNLPDHRGRVAVGLGTNASVSSLNSNDGQAVGNRRPHHRTSNSLSISPNPHQHTATVRQGTGSSGTQNFSYNDPTTTGTLSVDATSLSVTGTVGTGVANDALDTPSFIVVNKIIKT